MKLLLLDGNSLVNRAFYGIHALNAPDGTPTNGIYGFLTILHKLLEEEKPDGLAVAFDLHAPTFRHRKFAAYKGTRKGMPEDLQVQMPLLKQVLDAMGILRVELEGWEADDLLGTLSRRCEAAGTDCVIVTGDRDAFQLITDRVQVLHVKTRMGQTETVRYTPEVFRREYGFAPGGMIDLKALMGDASDNIPGVPGVGEKTALTLMSRFGSLEGVYAGLEDPEVKPAVRRKLEEGRESALLSYDLATICTDAPLEAELDAARWEGKVKPELYDLFLRLGFTKFIDRYGLKPEAGSDGAGAQTAPRVQVITCEADVRAAAAALSGGVTDVYAPAGAERILLHRTGQVWLLSRAQYTGDYTEALSLLLGPEAQKNGHNIKDLQRELLALGIPAEGWVFDCALAAYLLDATAGSYAIDRLCTVYCGFRPWQPEAGTGQMSLLDGAETDDGWDAADGALAAALDTLRGVLSEKLEKLGMAELYRTAELPLCAVLAGMEQTGVLVDRQALTAFGESLTGDIEALQQSIWDLAGEEFNINSPKQLGTILFEKLQLPAGKRTRTGWSTNADVLDGLRDKAPIVRMVLDYRELTKLKSTYADGLLKVIGPDGRIHSNFKMTVTATGRLSSAEPNLQNIPVRRELGSGIRGMFTAGPGCVLVDADYSQIELRLLADISGDEAMIAAFRTGEDIHRVTAAQVFGIPAEAVTGQMRSRAKAVNFGIVYGISAFSLARDIGVSQPEAKAYMEAYLAKYHGVRDYQQRVVEQAGEEGFVSTRFGRRRYLPELRDSKFAIRSFGERVAMNMPIQGTAADVIKLAMVRVDRVLREAGLAARLILQVHDELIVECPEGEACQVAVLLKREMEAAADFRVPLTAEAGVGCTWLEAKG